MKLKLPHTYVLLFALVVAAALATHVIPAGEYERVDRGGRTVVDPASYQEARSDPASVADVFLAFPRGLSATADIVFFIFIIGGAFGVVNATGAIEGAIEWIIAKGGRGERVIPVLMLVFALAGGSLGMAEETLVFLPALLVLSRRLGYDAITAGAVGLVGAGAGFAGAFMNPFTVGVAQGIAELPLFSGIGYRLVVWVVVTSLAIFHVMRYSARVRSAPQVSEPSSMRGLKRRHILVLLLLAATVGAFVVGALQWGWGLLELSGVFVAVTFLAGWLGGLGADEIAENFIEGAAGITTGALVVGLARGVLVIFDGALVTDTILHALAGAVENLPRSASVVGIYLVQVLLNFIVPSGSGQAALSIPILAPLGDLVGVTRQTTVLAYQFGDGFTNVLTPTQGYFMAGLAMIGVKWTDWVRFIWPLQCLWLIAGLVLLLTAHAMQYGPF
ncbi:MAG TPA: AbgT family transporter [Vicinamibacteria bacterium]|nr:AbgT family transporter [Vicinamibacteria bacterium]